MSVKRRMSYEEAARAMQAGVALDEAHGAKNMTPKHLRVGVNSALCDSTALAKLLIAKGVITESEYVQAIADEMNLEVERYEQWLAESIGHPVTLDPGSATIHKVDQSRTPS